MDRRRDLMLAISQINEHESAKMAIHIRCVEMIPETYLSHLPNVLGALGNIIFVRISLHKKLSSLRYC